MISRYHVTTGYVRLLVPYTSGKPVIVLVQYRDPLPVNILQQGMWCYLDDSAQLCSFSKLFLLVGEIADELMFYVVCDTDVK